jgi:hypothetical protein
MSSVLQLSLFWVINSPHDVAKWIMMSIIIIYKLQLSGKTQLEIICNEINTLE